MSLIPHSKLLKRTGYSSEARPFIPSPLHRSEKEHLRALFTTSPILFRKPIFTTLTFVTHAATYLLFHSSALKNAEMLSQHEAPFQGPIDMHSPKKIVPKIFFPFFLNATPHYVPWLIVTSYYAPLHIHSSAIERFLHLPSFFIFSRKLLRSVLARGLSSLVSCYLVTLG
jgi:hypothetical protein